MVLKNIYIIKYKAYKIWSYNFKKQTFHNLQLTQSFLFKYQNNFYSKTQIYLKLFANINCFLKNFINYQQNFIVLGSNYFFNTLHYNFKNCNFNCLTLANKMNFFNIHFFKHKLISKQLIMPTLIIDLNFQKKIQKKLELPIIGSNNLNDYLIPSEINGIFAFYFFFKFLLKTCFWNFIWI